MTHYSYDGQQRVTSVSGPQGTVGYGYDATGNRIRLTTMDRTVGYGYDALNRLAVVTDTAGLLTRYGYDLAGLRQHVVLPNGAQRGVTEVDPQGTARSILGNYDATYRSSGMRRRPASRGTPGCCWARAWPMAA